jgi:sulfate transport system permease protein
VSLLVVIPLAGLFFKSASLSWAELRAAATDRNVIASLKLSFGLSLVAACINVVFGFITAWTLVRYKFPGRRLVDGLVDLPFALPTAVSGITLATLYVKDGWLGKPWAWFYEHANPAWHAMAGGVNWALGKVGISSLLAWAGLPDGVAADLPEQIAYGKFGMLIALIFIGMPFIVRTLQPALEDLDPEIEEAATSLGASRFQAFRRVVLPALLPAILTGFALSFARAVGEYGSVIFISSNIPGETQITAHLIVQKLSVSKNDQFDYAGATFLGVIMLLLSFAALATVNAVQWWSARRSGVAA